MLRRAGLLLASALVLLAAATPAGAATPKLIPVGTFASPIYVTAPPGDTHRVFVVERGGRIQVLDDGVKHQFLDITSLVSCCDGERGLASMAFAPDYATSGIFYVFYAAVSPVGQLTVVEYHRSSNDPDAADPSSARVLLTVPHDQQSNHNGGQLQIGPDGDLYIGTGDGGSGGDPAGNGQNLTSSNPPVVDSVNHNPLLGKILRIDPRQGDPYAIPAGNPFPAPAREVFAYGLRNPWRFSFDRVAANLSIADVGQDAYEEVDEAPAPGRGVGANYGWSLYEGLHTYPGGSLVSPPFPAGYTFPVLEKSHVGDGYCAIEGGYVVRDPALPELAGQYVYGDLCSSALRAVWLGTSGTSGDHSLGLSVSDLDSFGEDGCGRVYAVSLDGPVYRLGTSGDCAGPSVPFSYPKLSIDDVSVSEGDTGASNATFHVTLSAPIGARVSVDYATADGTAKAPDDYTSTSGTLTFAPGETSKAVSVPIVGDTVDEPNETFYVTLPHPARNATRADSTGRGTIVDDDPLPTLRVGDASRSEGDSGTANMDFTVTLTGATARTVTVDYSTVDGTATAPGDYTSRSGTLTFAPGETSKTVSVPIAGDTVDEPNETFSLSLPHPATNALRADPTGRGTIVDDDPSPTLRVADASQKEGDSGTSDMSFTVTLTGATARTASVDYSTVDGTATAPGDYTSRSGTLTFAPGETSKTISVPIVGDTVHEANETFRMTLPNPATNATRVDPSGTGTIVDDDPAPTLARDMLLLR